MPGNAAQTASLPKSRIRALERRIGQLNRECGEKISALVEAANAVIDPMQQELEKLQKRTLEPSELVAEHKAWQAEYWKLREKRAPRGGWKEETCDDVDALFDDRELYTTVLRETHSIEKKLKLLGVNIETAELEFFALHPPAEVEARLASLGDPLWS